MPDMGALFVALAEAVRTLMRDVLGEPGDTDISRALDQVRLRREHCTEGAYRRARLALEHGDEPDGDRNEGEWLGYAALLVQVDRIVIDLGAPLPT